MWKMNEYNGDESHALSSRAKIFGNITVMSHTENVLIVRFDQPISVMTVG